MSLLQMSFTGAILILVITVIRAVAINRLPKRIFIVLWWVALLRLLLPVSIPSMYSAYSLIYQSETVSSLLAETPVNSLIPQEKTVDQGTMTNSEAAWVLSKEASSSRIWFAVWCIGMGLCMLFFVICFLYWRLEFRTSLPVKSPFADQWLETYQRKRPISIRQSDRIKAPLTYGILRPVILMPKETDWEDEKQLSAILLHEYAHICSLDAAVKLIVTIILCIHWFNPAAWLMYILFNRDMELACDEQVIRRMGRECRASYANTLIHMQEQRSILRPLCNNFSRNAIEERITAIMKTRKMTRGILCIGLMVIVAVVMLFVTSASDGTEESGTKQMLYFLDMLYISTGEDVTEKVNMDIETSQFDTPLAGVITSTVDSTDEPGENRQSNFGCVGSELAFCDSGIAVNMDGKWILFETDEMPKY